VKNFENKVVDQVRKDWINPVLEVLTITNTEYWRFDESGDFPMNVWVEES
jgi:hypothetical protein